MLSPNVTETVRHGRVQRTMRTVQRNASRTLDVVALAHATHGRSPERVSTVARVMAGASTDRPLG